MPPPSPPLPLQMLPTPGRDSVFVQDQDLNLLRLTREE